MKRCPFTQTYCMEKDCMLWDEQCAFLEMKTHLERIYAANTAIWNQMRNEHNASKE